MSTQKTTNLVMSLQNFDVIEKKEVGFEISDSKLIVRQSKFLLLTGDLL